MLAVIKGLGPGGAEQLLLSQARLHDRTEIELSVAYLVPWKDALVAPLEGLGVDVHCLDAPRPRDVRWTARLRRLLETGGYDVVHVHSPYAAPFTRAVARTLPRRSRPAVISTEHNVWSSFSPATRFANAALFPLGDAWLAVSDAARDSIPRRLRSRVETLVHGIILDDAQDARSSRAAIRAELGLAPDDVGVITVANLRPNKAYEDLMAAAASVLERSPPVRVKFFAAGQGQLEQELRERHARMDLGHAFTFLGQRSDVLALLGGCDVFALASRYEGYPVAIMEALAVGLPVVATRVGGIPDAVRDGVDGLLTEPGRPDELADALQRLVLDADLRREMAASARTRADRFSMHRTTTRLEEIYRSKSRRR